MFSKPGPAQQGNALFDLLGRKRAIAQKNMPLILLWYGADEIGRNGIYAHPIFQRRLAEQLLIGVVFQMHQNMMAGLFALIEQRITKGLRKGSNQHLSLFFIKLAHAV